uniref:RNase H family protein n=1 Tax=Chryseobacterium endophyticum TaxID=1854762 RepID=A0AAU6WRM8_9FLAO
MDQAWLEKCKKPDLWQKFVSLYNLHKPKMHWIKGHAGHFENELCDKLAVTAAASPDLEVDHYFESLENNTLF